MENIPGFYKGHINSSACSPRAKVERSWSPQQANACKSKAEADNEPIFARYFYLVSSPLAVLSV